MSFYKIILNSKGIPEEYATPSESGDMHDIFNNIVKKYGLNITDITNTEDVIKIDIKEYKKFNPYFSEVQLYYESKFDKLSMFFYKGEEIYSTDYINFLEKEYILKIMK